MFPKKNVGCEDAIFQHHGDVPLQAAAHINSRSVPFLCTPIRPLRGGPKEAVAVFQREEADDAVQHVVAIVAMQCRDAEVP